MDGPLESDSGEGMEETKKSRFRIFDMWSEKPWRMRIFAEKNSTKAGVILENIFARWPTLAFCAVIRVESRTR